ncbi:MAG: cytochrome c biogenesis protein CcsA, partial [Thermoplasmata archaeon]
MILLVAFISLSIYVDIFTETNSVALVLFPDGQGLNPLLLTPLMVFHPPLEFAAYALITIPFASALSFLITGKKDWVDVSLLWSRLSWLFLTVAMGIGALWAYTVLGWGGYWGWDPVEVSNLLPWIALTAFAHTQSYYKKRNQYPFVSPLLAVLAFVLVIFATFETRTGLVISPLHAFVGPGGGVEDPAERLIAIMNGNPVASYFMMLMIASLIFAGILFLWRFAKIREKEGLRKGPILWFAYIYITFLFILLIYAIASTPSFISFSLTIASAVGAGKEGIGLVILCLLLIGIPVVWIVLTSREKEESGRTLTLEDIINDKNTMILSVTILSIWFITTFLLMIIGAGGLQPYVFESRLPLILVPLSITLVVCLVWRYLGRNVAVYTAIGLIMAALLGYAILSNKMFGAYVAVVLAALVASFYRLLKIASGRRRIGMHRLSLSGLFLVLAGTIGIVFWTNLTRTTFLSLDIKPSISLAILGFLASSIALTAGLSCTRNTAPKLCVIGSFCGILSFGFFFVGTILSIVSLILILTSYSSFLKTGNSLRSLKTMFRATSPHLIHLGIMLLLLGYVASTTMSAEKDFKPYSNPMIKGSSASFEGYELKLVDSEGKDLDGDGTYESIDSVVEISHSGSYLGRAVLR